MNVCIGIGCKFLFRFVMYAMYDTANMTISWKACFSQEPIKLLSFLTFPDR